MTRRLSSFCVLLTTISAAPTNIKQFRLPIDSLERSMPGYYSNVKNSDLPKIQNFIVANLETRMPSHSLLYILSHADNFDDFGRIKKRSADAKIPTNEETTASTTISPPLSFFQKPTLKPDTGSIFEEQLKEIKERKDQLKIKHQLLSHITRFTMLNRKKRNAKVIKINLL